MSAKMGRPTSNPRHNNTRLRMTDEEVEKLNYCVKVTGRTKTDIMMMGLDKIYQELKR